MQSVPPDTGSPLTPFLERNGALILDGGLATELEARGYQLGDGLWSARLLHDAPQAIQQVHTDYLTAGADCVITASYQASIPGFLQHDYSETQAVDLLRRSVELAVTARDVFWAEPDNQVGRLRPLVAASIGPYGAYLADGSEYTGHYGLSEDELVAFHRRRWQLLADTDADLLACETIPSAVEARAFARLLKETPERFAWLSFSCGDAQHISDGTLLADAIALFVDTPQVVALGINCTPPQYVLPLIAAVRRVTQKPVIVYPNSGEVYNAETKQWEASPQSTDFATVSQTWRQAGAVLIGGCCRIGPSHIETVRNRLLQRSAQKLH
jgi:homocysteine S-methyltransferase